MCHWILYLLEIYYNNHEFYKYGKLKTQWETMYKEIRDIWEQAYWLGLRIGRMRGDTRHSKKPPI